MKYITIIAISILLFSACASEKLNQSISGRHLGKHHKIKKTTRSHLKSAKSRFNESDIHIVKRGETLSEIAKSHNITVNELKKINNIKNINHLLVGAKLYFNHAKYTTKADSIAFANTPLRLKKGKFKKSIRLTATAYTSHRNETDSTPFLAAWNNRLKPGMKIIAVSHDLIRKYGITNGTRVKIKGLKGHYIVRDKMNPRFTNRIDLYMGLSKYRAYKWGKRKITMLY